jgi:hypothetical protein
MVRAGTAANTAERIRADADVLASATRIYGANSSQQKAALAQLLADEKAYDASVVKEREQGARQQEIIDIDAAQSAMAVKRQQIETAFALGDISRKQELAEGAKGAATAEGVASRNAIEATGAAQSKALDAATGKSQITSAAATGAAKAYQAIVGIPYVGPVLAPIAAGVAFAGIEAFSGMISSARGGWERVPFDGAMTELHKDEMVLPAHIANPMRQMAQKGGQGGGNHYHINAMDMRSFTEAARRNQGGLAKVMKQAARNGHFSSRR